jgi:hypothetical protein
VPIGEEELREEVNYASPLLTSFMLTFE